MSPHLKLTSFENASILRKVTIFYFIMSIVPISVLYYLYLQVRTQGHIEITEERFSVTLFLVVLGVGVGYIAMRSMIVKIVNITSDQRANLETLLGPQRIKAIVSSSNNEIAILTQSFNEVTSRLEENIRNLELAKKTLHSVLSKVGEGLSSMDNIDNFLNLIVETVTEAMHAQVGVLLFLDQNNKDSLIIKTVYGKEFDSNKSIKMDLDGIFTPVIHARQPMIIEKIPREGVLPSLFKAPMLCAPMMLHDQPLGIIVVCGRRSEENFDDEEKNLLQNLALQTAVAIENSQLNEDAERTYFETIAALALAVEAKDPYSRGHLERVAKYVVQIGKEVNLNRDEINVLRDAARLHDIGKIGVTDDVLSKKGPLNVEEMEMMKKHCEIGEGIIKPIRSLKSLCDLVRHHHEKLDGSGYPDGLKGPEIHTLVRILTVADIFDALTSNRPYRKPFSEEKAVEELRAMKDQVDQKFVEVLARVLSVRNFV